MRVPPSQALPWLALLASTLAIDAASAHMCAPSARHPGTAVWTGTELIVWGGSVAGKPLGTGARYNPVTDRWTTMSTVGAPAARATHSAVWTGSEMIVWGGWDEGGILGTGGRYDPATDTWTEVTRTGGPQARMLHSATWTGTGMIVHGGHSGHAGGDAGVDYAHGALYDPAKDAWSHVPDAPDARRLHRAAWTPDGMLVWGGFLGAEPTNAAYRYDPATKTWTALSRENAPHGFVQGEWTGEALLAWGGARKDSKVDTGYRYDPMTAAWSPLPTAGAPSARTMLSVVWTGTEAIAWGGVDDQHLAVSTAGARLDLAKGKWRPIAIAGAPAGRWMHHAAWTGKQMLVWGGFDANQSFGDGALYDPALDRWTPMSTLCAGHDH